MAGRPRPHVTIVCATSLDGKLSTAARDPVRFTSREDRARLHALEDASDAILVGAATIRAEDPPLLPTPERSAARVARGLAPFPIRAILSRSGVVPIGRALAPVEGAPVHVLGGPSLAEVLGSLASLGARTVLCEGGGEVNACLLEADLVDELRLTLCPVLIGGKGAPTLFDGSGFPADSLRRLRLVRQAVSSAGELFLDYQLVPRTGG